MKLSQSFHSIQGEGISTGVDAYFIRFTGCNLSCGTSLESLRKLNFYLKDNPDESGSAELDREYGDLLRENKASWVCDTTSVWLTGQDVTNEGLEGRLANENILSKVIYGVTHLIWTGGEPTMPIHQKSIEEFLRYFLHKYPYAVPYNEIETNGTIKVTPGFYECHIHQINCSPKLSNSGMPLAKRINPEAILQIKKHHNSWFKFVITKEKDLAEIQDDYLNEFQIPHEKVILMPGADNRKDLLEVNLFVAEMTKKYGYRSCTRLQVALWDKVTGV